MTKYREKRSTDGSRELETRNLEGERLIQAAARRGARSSSSRRQVVEDAVEEALMRWEEHLMRGSTIADAAAWAFKVAKHAARKIGKRSDKVRVGIDELTLHEAAVRRLAQLKREAPVDQPDRPGFDVGRLPNLLADNLSLLTEKQRLCVMKLSEPHMSLKRASKELRMDRSGLRRLFARALAALKHR